MTTLAHRYRVTWREQAPPDARPAAAQPAWAIVADESGVGAALARELAACGRRVVYLSKDTLPLDDGRAFHEAVSSALEGEPDVRAVYLCGLDLAPGATEAAQQRIAARAVDLVQILAIEASIGSASLSLVTRGAHGIGSGSEIVAEQAALWGLGRVIRFEHPELACRRLDLDPRMPVQAAAEFLARELERPESEADEDEVAVRDGARWVARIEAAGAPRASGAGFAARADRTYLVTGGTGFLGLHVAEWLRARGACSLALACRTEPRARALQRIEQLRASGCAVALDVIDLGHPDAVDALLKTLDARGRPLGGVFHLAGGFGDSELLDLAETELVDVMAARAFAALRLDRATRNRELDAFVLFGSSVWALGAPGQSAFTAANALLFSLSAERRRRGLPTLCVGWGPWLEPGIDAGGALAGFEPSRALALLAEELASPGEDVLVLPQDLGRLLEFYPRAASMARLRHLTSGVASPDYARRELSAEYAPPRDRIERTAVCVVRKMLALDRVGIRDDFFELGGDSVTGAGALDRINRLLGTEITFETAIEAFTIEQLAECARLQLGLAGSLACPTRDAGPPW